MSTNRFPKWTSVVLRSVRQCTSLLILGGLPLLHGCRTIPPAEVDAHRSVAEAVGLNEPVLFLEVGPGGRPLNESDDIADTLSLSQAVRLAVTSDPGLQAALARVRVALADADQARLLSNPVITLVMRWGPGRPQIEAAIAQDIVRALQVPRRSSAADNRLRQAAADAMTVAIDVAAEVQERYVFAQASGARIPILRERMSLLDQLARVAQARLDAGEGTRNDLATLESQQVELQVEIDQAELNVREDRLRLARLIGAPSSAADWTLDPWAPPASDVSGEVHWVESALRNRPEIQAVAWRLAALGDDEALARFGSSQAAEVGFDAARDDDWFAGPSGSLSLPVFDNGRALRARLTAEQMEARYDLTLARRRVVEEVRLAHESLVASNANLARINTQLLPIQRHRRALAEDAYRAGFNDVTAIYLAEHDLQIAHTMAVEIGLQAATAWIRLQRAVGGPGIAAAVADSPPVAAAVSNP